MRCRARVLFDGQGIVVKLGAKNDLEKLETHFERITKLAWICDFGDFLRIGISWDSSLSNKPFGRICFLCLPFSSSPCKSNLDKEWECLTMKG